MVVELLLLSLKNKHWFQPYWVFSYDRQREHSLNLERLRLFVWEVTQDYPWCKLRELGIEYVCLRNELVKKYLNLSLEW